MSGRVLALDVGGKRIGVALSDPDRIIASGQPTIQAQPAKQAYQAIRKIVEEQGVTQIVIGLPLTMRGEIGPQAELVQEFAAELAKRVVKTPIELYDERLTSVAAERSMEAMGMKRQQRRDQVDQMAATLILQAFLEGLRRPPPSWPDDDDGYDDEDED